jgi:hypothetical protein
MAVGRTIGKPRPPAKTGPDFRARAFYTGIGGRAFREFTMKKMLALAALAATFTAPAMAQDACLRVGEIYDWKAMGDRTVIVEDNFHQKFKLDLLGDCTGLTFKLSLAFVSPGSMAISCVSPGDSVAFRQSPAGPQNCPIKAISVYTPAMEKVDKEAAAAKKAAN